MPGKKINQNQIGLYMKYRKEGLSQIASAAKAGFSERSARNIQKRGYIQAKPKRSWKTRKDPFIEVWESDLVPLLEKNPTLQAKVLLEDLQHRYPDRFPDKLLRTLQRRVQKWRALHGPSKEIIFRQKHPPGFQGLSDFTQAKSLGVTVDGEVFNHSLYHYRLAYSGWEHAEVVLGGESFSALSEGLQNALWMCGGVPKTHRTDSLSAAFKNLSSIDKEDLTRKYEELAEAYGMEATRNNRGVSHENGTVEVSHRHLKSRINQALMIRGSRDFKTVEEYRQFVHQILIKHNRRINKEYLNELAHLKALPERRTIDFAQEYARVTNSSTIRIKNVIYSVPSRLIGMTLKVHLFDDRLELFLGMNKVISLERIYNHKKKNHQINYRHVVDQLVKKPGAFNNYIYKESMFPTLSFRLTWGKLLEFHGIRKACCEYVKILKEAAQEGCEGIVDSYLEKQLRRGKIPTSSEIHALFHKKKEHFPEVKSTCESLEYYDELIGGES